MKPPIPSHAEQEMLGALVHAYHSLLALEAEGSRHLGTSRELVAGQRLANAREALRFLEGVAEQDFPGITERARKDQAPTMLSPAASNPRLTVLKGGKE